MERARYNTELFLKSDSLITRPTFWEHFKTQVSTQPLYRLWQTISPRNVLRFHERCFRNILWNIRGKAGIRANRSRCP